MYIYYYMNYIIIYFNDVYDYLFVIYIKYAMQLNYSIIN